MKSSLATRSATGLAALLIAAMLAGCAVAGRSAATEPYASTMSGSAPAVGSAAAKGGELSAVATVQAWVAARNESMATGDSSDMRALTDRTCMSCRAVLASTGEGGYWTVDSARVIQQGARSAKVRARVSVAARRSAPRRLTLKFEVGRGDGSTVTQIAVLP
jgi:hypothetical protein